MKTLPFICVALLASSLAAAATTATPATSIDRSRQRAVSYADLDLSKAHDAETLYRRVKTAARDVCWMPGLGAVMASVHQRRCIEDTVKRAFAEVNAPGLKDCTRCTYVARVDQAK